ncbi:MAG: hypothetical protein KIT31_28060 [Deltaproteobacteria bacterium]|nr:hypothetical protein [Deltaproteobacteria bacterium]
MRRRWPVLVGIPALSAALAAACRQPSDSAPSREPEPTPAARVAAPAQPELPGSAAPVPPPKLPPPPPSRPAAETFAEETRDPTWAAPTEAALAQRLAKVRGGKIAGTECRHSQCQITLAGTPGEIKKSIADLESHRGLHGFARTLVLTAPEKKPNGSLLLRAYAVFER